jgi:AcrR family transcriptional regulator
MTMARTGGDKTRKRILDAAERLFAAGGFHATSVDQIARTAGVNKALIYYHFADKSALVQALFSRIIEEVEAHVASRAAAARASARPRRSGRRAGGAGRSGGAGGTGGAGGAGGTGGTGEAGVKEELRQEVEFLRERRRIVALLLAEALRGEDRDNYLFRCAALGVEREHGAAAAGPVKGRRRLGPAEQRRQVHEFFTGFVPLIAFVTLGERWCDFIGGDRAGLVDDFLDAFARSHLASHGPA